MQKQYLGNVLHIFDLYYQDLAKEVIWENGMSMNKEEKELNDDLNKQLDWIELIDLKDNLVPVGDTSRSARLSRPFV